ncbi:NT_PAP_TUTase_domain-containing protein [Hexamita inflata]|uniref:NT_PAP_TUTase domain-containing protein n=1 Tax=Hexamita inflata TaxID=28002 RepID=A0AA86VMV4_9EUKA|nr:NT_PAP_TUTase domain-containing protein [Hexamita inflata]
MAEVVLDNEIRAARQFQNAIALTQRCDCLLQLIGPTSENYKLRQDTFKLISQQILQRLPSALLVPYGSFVSKCYLFNSDIDFCCWAPSQDVKETFVAVQKILQSIPDIQQIQPIDAEVPVIKCSYMGIGCDISFSQPAGILTAYMLELLDQTIQKNHLYKRSLVLIQNYCLNESHTLGSHNFMLSSYALRTMVAFILFQQPQISSPLQTLVAFLDFFGNFDFENNVVTLFGVMSQSQFQFFQSSQQALSELQKQFGENVKQNLQIVKLIQQINHLIGLRVSCDDKYLRQNGYFDVVLSLLDEDNKTDLHEFFKNQATTVSEKQFGVKFDSQLDFAQQQEITNNIVAKFIKSKDVLHYFKDESSFSFKYVNVSDPLLPSNNLGKSVSKQNLNRMQRAMQMGCLQLQQLLHDGLYGDQTVVQCLAEFDTMFVNTLALVSQSPKQNDFQVDDQELYQAILKVVSVGFGLKSKGVVWDK